MNKVILEGRLTKDVELRESKDKKTKFGRVCLAVTRTKDVTDFIDLVVIGKIAETLEKWSGKGLRIIAEGQLQQNNYTTKEGKEVVKYEVLVNNIDIIDFKKESQKVAEDSRADDLPF